MRAMKLNPESWEYKRRVERMKRTRKLFCKECEKEYTLGEPCIHHCSDSREDQARYSDLRKKAMKSKEITTTASAQKDLYYQGDST
jgi:hypothetical protein